MCVPPSVAPLLAQCIYVCVYARACERERERERYCHVTFTISLNDIIRLIFVKDLQCVYCEAEYLNVIHIEFML
jgi:hypothetical protein